jgi:hypothetical protein
MACGKSVAVPTDRPKLIGYKQNASYMNLPNISRVKGLIFRGQSAGLSDTKK